MLIEAAAVVAGYWLFDHTCRKALAELFDWEKQDDRERAARENVAAAVARAGRTAQEALYSDGGAVPAGTVELFADFLELCGTAASGGTIASLDERRLGDDLTREQASVTAAGERSRSTCACRISAARCSMSSESVSAMRRRCSRPRSPARTA